MVGRGAVVLCGCAGRLPGVKPGQWPAYARDPGGPRQSPLTQVNRGTVAQLEVAWAYRTGELAAYGGTTFVSKAAFEATPLMVDGVLSQHPDEPRHRARAGCSGP